MLPASDNCNLPWICLSGRLSCIGLMPYDVGGSGDCFFRSVSHQLYGTPELHFEIRMAGIKHLNNHPEIYIESFSDSSWEDYIRQMSIPGTWCDNIIIQAVANAHNCIVHITESDVDKPHGTIITPILHEGRSNTIFIGYINELHYVSTIPHQNSQNRNKFTYLKRKLLQSDNQKEERLAKRRSARHAETDEERKIRLLNIQQNVAKKRATKTNGNSKIHNSEHSNTNHDNSKNHNSEHSNTNHDNSKNHNSEHSNTNHDNSKNHNFKHSNTNHDNSKNHNSEHSNTNHDNSKNHNSEHSNTNHNNSKNHNSEHSNTNHDNSRNHSSKHSNTNHDNTLTPLMEQKHVLKNIDLFHESNKYLIKQCSGTYELEFRPEQCK